VKESARLKQLEAKIKSGLEKASKVGDAISEARQLKTHEGN
jgi:hypothetical protein